MRVSAPSAAAFPLADLGSRLVGQRICGCVQFAQADGVVFCKTTPKRLPELQEFVEQQKYQAETVGIAANAQYLES